MPQRVIPRRAYGLPKRIKLCLNLNLATNIRIVFRMKTFRRLSRSTPVHYQQSPIQAAGHYRSADTGITSVLFLAADQRCPDHGELENKIRQPGAPWVSGGLRDKVHFFSSFKDGVTDNTVVTGFIGNPQRYSDHCGTRIVMNDSFVVSIT